MRRIWCVGRNYIEHIREMGKDEREPRSSSPNRPTRSSPDGGVVPYPPLTKDMHHEVELVVALKSGGRNISRTRRNDCIWGYGVGIDLTRRDLQIASRKIKRPWEIGKAFDALGAVRPAESRPPKSATRPRAASAQGQRRREAGRRSRADDLERAGNDLEAVADGGARRRRHHHDRHAGGVGQVNVGDEIECEVEGVGKLTVTMAPMEKEYAKA